MTVPQQRSQQQPWPSTVAQHRATVAPPVQQPPAPAAQAPAAHRAIAGRSAVEVLRVITYVLTSIASLLFILLVIYGAVKLGRLSDALSTSPFGGYAG